MDLIFITNDVARATIAQEAGVERIMVDLEFNGKEARQGHLNTVISRHKMEDVRRLSAVLKNSRLLVRINPLFAGTEKEIEECVMANADIIMLPMFTGRREVARFISLLGGRARACLLLETPQAFVRADDILSCPGIDEVHIGLNDLHLGLGLSFMFELVAHGVVEHLAEKLRRRNIKFGFGGVARLGGGVLDARLVLSEHVRLGSSQVILSRDFQKIFDKSGSAAGALFAAELQSLRDCLEKLTRCSHKQLSANAQEVKRVINALAEEEFSAASAGASQNP